MKAYVIDAVAFLAYLADNLPENANNIFKKAEKFLQSERKKWRL